MIQNYIINVLTVERSGMILSQDYSLNLLADLAAAAADLAAADTAVEVFHFKEIG